MNTTKVVSVKVKDIRPEYKDLNDWMKDPNNVYIGRKLVVFIDRKRYPPHDSIWANPFKITDKNTREMVIKQYREYILKKIKDENLSLDDLRGKNLGCWCKEDGKDISCHGDVLLESLK